jgi:hypothetical protein
MKKEITYIMLGVFLFISISFAVADASYFEEDYSRSLNTDSSFVEVTKLRYESYPVSPGDYFTIYIQAQKTGTVNTNVKFELLEEYPFSLDSNEDPIRTFNNLNNEPVVLEYKVRVDDSAVGGENVLKLRQGGSGATVIREFDIIVEDVQTSFDAVVQDNTNSELSIALANIGQNDANAAIVRIPEQEGVVVSGTSGQMIGNLEQGDYTVVGFTLSGKASSFNMQIDYTDSIGIRRSEIIEIPLSGSGSAVVVSGGTPDVNFANRSRPQVGATVTTSWTTYLVWIFVLVVLGFISYKYVKKKKNTKGNSSIVPEWIKKAKGAK